MNKSDRFKQKGPRDQLTAIRSALDGTIEGYIHGTLSRMQLAINSGKLIADLSNLEKHISNEWAEYEISDIM